MAQAIVNAAVCTDIGAKRSRNEDNFFLIGETLPIDSGIRYAKKQNQISRGVFAVCDGMGAEGSGGDASGIAANTLTAYADRILSDGRPAADAYASDVNGLILSHVNESGYVMGTTLALVRVFAGKAAVWGIGDSRVYLCRGRRAIRLIDDGTSDSLDFDKPVRHLGTPLGGAPTKLVFGGEHPLYVGDALLLCTDGVSDVLNDSDLVSLLSSGAGSENIARSIVERSLERGSPDNITALVIVVLAADSEKPRQTNMVDVKRFADIAEQFEPDNKKDTSAAVPVSPVSPPKKPAYIPEAYKTAAAASKAETKPSAASKAETKPSETKPAADAYKAVVRRTRKSPSVTVGGYRVPSHWQDATYSSVPARKKPRAISRRILKLLPAVVVVSAVLGVIARLFLELS